MKNMGKLFNSRADMIIEDMLYHYLSKGRNQKMGYFLIGKDNT